MKTVLTILAVGAALLLGGCQTGPSALQPAQTTKFSIEGTEKFALLDEMAQATITCSGLQERVNDEGRLEIVANVKNRENRSVRVELRCVFKDANGFSTGDETPWRTLQLGDGATEAVRYTSGNSLAHKYTIVVRAARGT